MLIKNLPTPHRGIIAIPIIVISVIVALVGIWFVYKNTSTTKVINQTSQTVQKAVLSKEDLLKQRVGEYLKSFQYYDYDKVYEFLTPEDKKLISKTDFVDIRKKADAEDQSLSALYKDAGSNIDSVEIIDNSATVRITNTSCLTGNCNLQDDKGIVKREDKGTLKWIYIENQWYRPLVSENKEFYQVK